MAVEATHLNLFSPQNLGDRELVMSGVEGNGNVFGEVAPLWRTEAAEMESKVPVYGSVITGALPVKTKAIKSDSSLTSLPVSRKRPRGGVNTLLSSVLGGCQNQSAVNRCSTFTFLGEDITFQIQQEQLEIDRFIAQHIEKVRVEVEERRKRYAWRIAAVARENIFKRLKAKEEEIENMGKLNHALEERVKSLCFENQIWRDVAQTNEATANALRYNLEQQFIAQPQDEHLRRQADAEDDASSCCGSNHDEIFRVASSDGGDGCMADNNRMCRICGREESCVLLLPCRHLCACTACESTLHACPICNAAITARIHVNLSC